MLDFLFAAGLCVAIDGDTLGCGEQRVRLHGIDAPDFDCRGRGDWCREDPKAADAARAHLAFVIRGAAVRCVVRDRDRYGRDVAECFVGQASSINCMMVAAGHAIDWPKYSGGRYAQCSKR